MKPHRNRLAASVVLAVCLTAAADDTPPKPAPAQQETPAPKADAPAPVAPPAKPASDAAADAASDAKAREILAKAAALQNAGDLAEPGKLESFHVVFFKATFERTTKSEDGHTTSTLVEADEDGLVFDWMKGSVKTQVTLEGRTTTKAWYEPMHSAWIFDGAKSSQLAGAKFKADYDQLQFHRAVVGQLLDVAILGKLLKDGSRWRIVAESAPREKTVAIERIPPAGAKGAVAITLWIANPSPGVYGDVVAASMPPTKENAATVFYEFKYDTPSGPDDRRELFPAVRVKTGDAAPAAAALRFPFVVTVQEQREGSKSRATVLEVKAHSVDVNTVTDADFYQPESKDR